MSHRKAQFASWDQVKLFSHRLKNLTKELYNREIPFQEITKTLSAIQGFSSDNSYKAEVEKHANEETSHRDLEGLCLNIFQSIHAFSEFSLQLQIKLKNGKSNLTLSDNKIKNLVAHTLGYLGMSDYIAAFNFIGPLERTTPRTGFPIQASFFAYYTYVNGPTSRETLVQLTPQKTHIPLTPLFLTMYLSQVGDNLITAGPQGKLDAKKIYEQDEENGIPPDYRIKIFRALLNTLDEKIADTIHIRIYQSLLESELTDLRGLIKDSSLNCNLDAAINAARHLHQAGLCVTSKKHQSRYILQPTDKAKELLLFEHS